jgi:Carboxypeptidase regulatory-like domain
VRMDALRRPDVASFAAQRLDPKERREVSEASKKLLGQFRETLPQKGQATKALVGEAGETAIAGIYLSVKDDADGGSLFERVRTRMGRLQIGTDNPEAVDRVYNAVALMDATETLMAQASVPSLAQLDAPRLEAAYVNFSDRLEDYAKTAPTDPEQVDRTTAAANMAMIDYSSAVSAQATTFSSAGLLGEAQRRILAIFQDLTLAGFARRNPGLEHRAGVAKGGTLVLAYASKAELAALMERAGPRLDKLADGLKLSRLTGSFSANLSAAAKEVLSVAGGRGNDPLSDFVVLADFCLPGKCCDADCSDIVLEGALPEKIFDLDGSGRMAVDPVIPNGILPGRPGNIPKREELSKLFDGIGVRPGNFESRRPILKRAEPAPDQPSRPDTPDRPSEPDQPSRPDTPDRPREPDPPVERGVGVVAGQVTGAGSLASTPVPNAALVANDLQTRAVTRIAVAARTGSFKSRLPAGKYSFTAEAEGFESTSVDVAVEPDSEQEIALRMKKAR